MNITYAVELENLTIGGLRQFLAQLESVPDEAELTIYPLLSDQYSDPASYEFKFDWERELGSL